MDPDIPPDAAASGPDERSEHTGAGERRYAGGDADAGEHMGAGESMGVGEPMGVGDPGAEAVGGQVPEGSREPAPDTGDDRVDAALARLAELDRRPVVEHVSVYDEVQSRLQDVLAGIDAEGPA